ncbi:MAG: RNA polymerase sigma factor [Planctomycetota bacterium]
MKNNQKILELLEQSGPSLYALLTKLTLNQDTAEELMQELFIKLNNSKTFQKAVYPTAYAHRTAINLALDWRRNRRKHLTLHQINEPSSENSSPLSRLIQNEQLQQILNAIANLKGVFGEVVVMRYIQQLSYDDIAAQLEKTAHQTRAISHKAITHLRNLMKIENSIIYKEEPDNVRT